MQTISLVALTHPDPKCTLKGRFLRCLKLLLIHPSTQQLISTESSIIIQTFSQNNCKFFSAANRPFFGFQLSQLVHPVGHSLGHSSAKVTRGVESSASSSASGLLSFENVEKLCNLLFWRFNIYCTFRRRSTLGCCCCCVESIKRTTIKIIACTTE